MKANIYLNFPGTSEEAFNFYKSVFGGEFMGGVMRFKGTPDGDKLSESDQNKVMHVALALPDGTLLMATDALESMGQKLTMGNNYYICLDMDSKEEADSYFAKLSQGGIVEMPMQDMFWGAYFGSIEDKYGVHWMVNFATPHEAN